MRLATLRLHSLRNFADYEALLHPDFNVIVGDNGCGKTTFLEAIYMLSTGHSFRTRDNAPLIRYEDSSLTVFAKTFDDHSISIAKSLRQATQVRIDGQPCHASSELARLLPCQIFFQSLFQIIDAGPLVRRELLDWGLFHVKQSYLSIWKQYKRVLKQRNALLQTNPTRDSCKLWDQTLVALAEQLHQLRDNYFYQWQAQFTSCLNQLSPIDCQIMYYKGWDRRQQGKSLESILDDSFDMDRAKKYTHYGAHQADIIISHQDNKAKQHFSRGQQKIILFALKCAQSMMLQEDCFYLLDDLASELDGQHYQTLLNFISQLKGQKFLTSLSSEWQSKSTKLIDATILQL